ncbi:hypothetical protein LPJ53_003470, partial [Coemansia erecta]
MALFTEKDEDLVKKFLFDKINNFCDADPGIMADYILVTLQNDMSESELKEHCKSDLIEFFGDSTSSFVDSLFVDLKAKKYLSADAAAAAAGDSNDGSTPVSAAAVSKSEMNDRSNGSSSHRRRSSRSPARDRHRHGDRERERERDRDRDRRSRSSRSPESRRSHREHRDSSHGDRSLLDGP